MRKFNLFKMLAVLFVLITRINTAWADITFYYMANMPDDWWTPSTSVTMTQSSTNTNRYYAEVDLTSGTTYGFCIHEGDNVYKNNSTAPTNEKFQMYKYDNDNNQRSRYTPSSTTKYIFTYDSGTKELYIGPKSGATIKVAYDVASGHDNWSNLNNYSSAMTQIGSTEEYYVDIDLTAVKYYMFVQIQLGNNSYAYWRGSSEVTIDGNPVSVYHYESNAFNKTDKLNFTPSVAGKYRFTWNQRYRTIKIQHLYKVSYNANGGSGTLPADSYHLSGSTVTVASNSGPVSKSNYNFGGWNTNNSGSGTNYTAGSGTFTMPSSDKTLYAKWTQTVTLNANTANHGVTGNGSATAIWNATALTGISHPSGEEGYTRTGYFTDPTGGTKVLNKDGTYANTAVTNYITSGKWSRTGAAPTLYAQWDNHYTVTLSDGGATIHGSDRVTATYGQAMPSITVPSKTGYIFGGYWTNSDGTGTQYYNEHGTSANNWAIASNTTLHAKWTGIQYSVAFDANEGSGEMANQGPLTYGAAGVALTTNTFTRTGYYFLGWNTHADGSGTKYYDTEEVSDLTSVDGQIVTLYAQWAKTYTLYFLNMGVDSWQNVSGNQSSTNRYAYAFLYYKEHKLEPLGTWTDNGPQGKRMDNSRSITLPNVGTSPTTWSWSISGVPEGATIIFSDNTKNNKTGDLSGWTVAKPYYCKGNDTWYALDGENTISKMTNMSVHIGEGDFGSWKYVGIDKHGEGEEDQYAIIYLNSLAADRAYQYKYSNWYQGGESGSPDDNAYIIKGYDTKAGYGGSWTLNGGKNVMVKTNTHASGEYKFVFGGWDGKSPTTKVYMPRGVNLTTTNPTTALAGEEVTVSFTANGWTNMDESADKNNLTYYIEFSKDNNNWTTVATVGPVSQQLEVTTSYTFAAQSGYFRAKLVNGFGLASYSAPTAFTAYSTKSFYVYNPYQSGDWSTLHLYTWDSNNNNTRYNGDFPGNDASSCIPGNAIQYLGNNWYNITIDERANCFMLVGNATYKDHQTVTCYVSNYIVGAKYMIYTRDNANYVEAYHAKGASDYRLTYTDSNGSRSSDIYNTTIDGSSVTTSMWMDLHNNNASLAIEHGTGENTWEAVKTYNRAALLSMIDGHTDHGYVFKMTLTLNTTTTSNSSVSNVTEYEGPFYVRTDGLDGGWNVYKKADHTMHHSASSLSHGNYDYYLCKWIGSAGTNVKYTIANDYNSQLVESLGMDANEGDPLHTQETLSQTTNVRFSWNSQTNTLKRAYLSAATVASSRFLVLEETGTVGKIYNESGTDLTAAAGGKVDGLNEHELIFADNGNWVYSLRMQANPSAEAQVTSKYNEKEQVFIPSKMLIGDDGKRTSKYNYQITYDFKTNILTNAWMAGGEINENIDLNTNVMIIRKGQENEDVAQISFESTQNIINAKNLIGVMQFEYSNMVGKMSRWNSQAYQYCMYYISFPYDVKVSEIFGIGEMGVDWRLQYYDGAERASKGFFRGDGTTTFWKDVPADGTLHAYEGYSLLLNRIRFNDAASEIWENKSAGSSVYLYFPSSKDFAGDSIIVSKAKEIHVPSHICSINRDFTVNGNSLSHKNTDSNWNMMGTPLFQNGAASTIGTPVATEGNETLQYFYGWDYTDNTLVAQAALNTQTFSAMHSYMVQYAGDVTFTGASIQAPGVAARKTTETKNYNIELQILDTEDKDINRTYVSLREGADAGFKLNEDMYLVTNKRAVNIYTLAGGYDVAGNTLPIANTIVPVGVIVKTAGTYKFSMPSNFSGTVTLVDKFANERTNLLIDDYEVYLSEGEIYDRFELEININNAPTAIDGVEDGSLKDGKAHKFIENGEMYILKDGEIFDARGAKVK